MSSVFEREAKIVNKTMEFAMELGKDWLQPIQERTGRSFTRTSIEELDQCDRLCRQVIDFGFEQVKVQIKAAPRNENEAVHRFNEIMTDRYPWLISKTLSCVFSQGCSYALKDREL